MTITVAQFREDFPEFTDATVYPDSAFTLWYGVAVKMLNADRWGNMLDIGTELYAAHQLALEARAFAEASAGGIPGAQVGPLNSKSVDKVSMGYDTSAGIEADAGHWNLTIYGTRFIRLAKMMGMGPVQIGVGDGSLDPLSALNAWSGPLTTPGFSNF